MFGNGYSRSSPVVDRYVAAHGTQSLQSSLIVPISRNCLLAHVSILPQAPESHAYASHSHGRDELAGLSETVRLAGRRRRGRCWQK